MGDLFSSAANMSSSTALEGLCALGRYARRNADTGGRHLVAFYSAERDAKVQGSRDGWTYGREVCGPPAGLPAGYLGDTLS